jgi:hypothetical protein
VVIDFAVENDNQIAAFKDDGLIAAVQIDNLQSNRAQ